MASCWIEAKRTASGERRYRVTYRLGGRESRKQNGGTFARHGDAKTRHGYIMGEIVAGRVPDLSFAGSASTAATLRKAADDYRATRVDVSESTRILHRVALARVVAVIGDRRMDKRRPRWRVQPRTKRPRSVPRR